MTKFYLKVIAKSPLIIISLLFSTFIMYVQSSSLTVSISSYARYTVYAYICFNLFFLASCTYVMNKKYEVDEFLENNLFKKCISVIAASTIISSLVFLIPLAIIIFYYGSSIINLNILLEILNFFLLWSLSNCLFSTIGCFIGLIINKWFAYIISFITYTLYLKFIWRADESTMKRLLCIFSDNIFVDENSLAPLMFNASYFLDKAFSILSLLLIINLVYFYIKKKKSCLFSKISFAAMTLLLLGTIIFSFKVTKMGIETYDDFVTSDYIIEDYTMNLKANSKFNNSCEVKVKSLNKTNNVVFMLDDIFNIESISVDDKICDFNHENNKVTINYDLEKNNEIIVKLNYSAVIDIRNYLGVNIYYVNNEYINLPDKEFYWYPYLNDNTHKNFNISLESNTEIYTNLNMNCVKNNNKYEYKLTGNDVGCSIFAGQYQSVTVDNITYIMPKNYNVDLLMNDIEDKARRIYEKSPTEEGKDKSDFIVNREYKKVIVGKWYSSYSKSNLEDEIKIYKDTIITN